jgi:hypothetical protein
MRAAWIGPMVAVGMSIGLVGCGVGSRVLTVASVEGAGISRTALAHQLSIANARLQGPSTQIPIPDPPGFERCIAAANAAQVRSKNRRRLTRRQLRAQCQRVYVELKDRALAFLITAQWLKGEAAAHGIVVSQSEVQATYRNLLNGPAGQSFAGTIKRRGMSIADELLELQLDDLTQKLEAKVGLGVSVSAAQIAGYYRAHTAEFRHQTLAAAAPPIRQRLLAAERAQHLAAFAVAYRRRWKQRTICQPGYVVAECRNGPSLPASPAK